MAFMAKARIIPPGEVEQRLSEARASSPARKESEAIRSLSEMTMIGFPVALLKRLTAEGARRNMSFAELLSTAVAEYLERTEPEAAPAPPKE